MALLLNGVALTKIVVEDDEETYFSLSSHDESVSLKIEYLPKLHRDFDPKDYTVLILENPYLEAENDVFQLVAKPKEHRLGWIFPIANLESNDNNFSDNKFLNRYKYVAFWHLAQGLGNQMEISQHAESTGFQLSRVYGDDAIILAISLEQVAKIVNFQIEDYLPNLSNYGYYLKNETPLAIDIDVQKEFALNQRGTEVLKVFRSGEPLKSNDYLKILYDRYLKSLNHELLRFHLLYQVIEHLISESFETDFDKVLTAYQAGNLDRGGLFEELKDIKQERKTVRVLFDTYLNGKPNSADIETNLSRDCKSLLDSLKRKSKVPVGDLVYDVRNLVVHNFRILKETDLELLNSISFQLERAIALILAHRKKST